MTIREQVSLLPYNTFGIDAKADYLIEYTSVEDLQEALRSDVVRRHDRLVAGEGSNLLFLGDFRGVVIRSQYRFIAMRHDDGERVLVEAGSGVVWDDFVAQCVTQGWHGAENLSLIPGQVGAAAVQNIGAYGVEVKDIIHEVHTVEAATGRTRTFTPAECRYGYRDSVFKNGEKGRYIVTSVTFILSRRPQWNFSYAHLEEAVKQRGAITLENVRDTIIDMRRNKLPDPAHTGNAGSFFKNPIIPRAQFETLQAQHPDISHFYVSEEEEKVSAAWLIDRCGWKGRRIGAAGVHDRQPLVLVNHGGATGADIARLAEEVQQSVWKKYGITLQPEVNYIGQR